MHAINMILMALPAATVVILPLVFGIALWSWLRDTINHRRQA